MSNKQKINQEKKQRRKSRVRAKISGTAKVPRLSIFRSLNHISAQLIDDQKGVTLASVKDADIKGKDIKNIDLAFKVGELISKIAKEKGIEKIVFDKSSYKYHGRVKAVADGTRQGGLNF